MDVRGSNFHPLSKEIANSIDRVIDAFLAQEGRFPTKIKIGLKLNPLGIKDGHKLIYMGPKGAIEIEWVYGYALEIS